MRTATVEEIAALELLAVELERAYALRTAVELERDRALRAVELELSHAVPFSQDTRQDQAASASSTSA